MDLTADPAVPDVVADLDALATEYWDTYLETHPLFATAIGDTRFDALLPDPTPEGTAAIRDRFATLLDRVNELDANGVTGEPAITLVALRATIASDLAELDAGLLDWNIDPIEGVPADFLLVPDYQRLESPEDGRRMVERWRAMAVYTDRHLESLRRSLADGRVACLAPGERTVAILEGLLDSPVDSWPLLLPLADLPDLEGWSTSERERFASDLRAAVEDEIRPAFVRLHDALVTEILPNARPADYPGLCHVPGRPGRLPRPDPRAHVARPGRRRRSTGSGWTRSPASTWSSPSSPGARSAPRRSRRRSSGCAPTPTSTSPRATSCSTRPRRAWHARTRRSPPGSAGCRGRAARSCGWDRTRRSTRRSPTTASPTSTARGPASTSSTRPSPRPGRATRWRR